MKRIALLTAAMLVATVASTDAHALSNRTFVSGNGSDSNPCSIAAPCRSFAGAIAQTSPGGEIAVLDTAGYGAVTITKAISIVNEEGVEAGITATGDGITVIASASDVVNLRGLTLVGAGSSDNNGIIFKSGGNLNIQNCVIRGFSNGNGLRLIPTGSADIDVSNTILSGNGIGIVLQPSGTAITVTASFEQVQMIHNGGDGFLLSGESMTGGTLHATAADSLASGNGLIGFVASSTNGDAAAVFSLISSKAINNQRGLLTTQNAAIFLNSSTVSGNSLNGFLIESGGVINSYGNNAITDTTNSGSLTHVALQ
jgi:hypothetical protein